MRSEPNLLALLGGLGTSGAANYGRELPERTGGYSSSFSRRSQISAVLQRIGSELHSQHVVWFAPGPTEKPGLHRLRAEIDGRPDLTVRVRNAYWIVDENPPASIGRPPE